MSGTSYATSWKIQQIQESGTNAAQEQLAEIAKELSQQVQTLTLLQQTIQNQLTLNFSYPVHKIHQPLAHPGVETFEFWHPFGDVQFLNSNLIRVGFENEQKIPIELIYEWGWYDLDARQGKIIIHISPAVKFFGFLEVNGFFLAKASETIMIESNTSNMSGDLIDGELTPHDLPINPPDAVSEKSPSEPQPAIPPIFQPPASPTPVEPQPSTSNNTDSFSPNVTLRFTEVTHAEDNSAVANNQIYADVMMFEPSLTIQIEAIADASPNNLLYADLVVEGAYRLRLNYPGILAEQQKKLQVTYNSKVYSPQVFPSKSGSLIVA
ncbi:MAG TPA: hypothetical protein VIQ31_33905 [Phormidium sp.]